MTTEVQGGADISEDGRYRYRLWRDGWTGDDDRACTFVILNPSTADAMTDDPTIRKCVGFCKRWGFGRLFVVNLFAFRSTDPGGLRGAGDPVGPANDVFVREEIAAARRVVLAWGSHAEVRDLVSRRVFEVRRFWDKYPDKLFTLGFCKDGSPRHPLMLAYATEPQKYAR
jgi:hypothetical protein